MIWRILAAVIGLILLYAVGQVIWRGVAPHPARPIISSRTAQTAAPGRVRQRSIAPAPPPPLRPCAADTAFSDAAKLNAVSSATAAWAVFGRAETGWAVYEPLAAREIGAACAADAEGFARALAAWQTRQSLPANGVMDSATLDALRLVWLRRRTFVGAAAHGDCPPPPAADQLAWVRPDEAYAAKPVQLRREALDAYRALVTEARRMSPSFAADRRQLTIFSGFRDPASTLARCDAVGDCSTPARARCSAHGTGLAMDIFLGAAPGYPPESSADPNRLYQSRTEAYRWMVANADRFGFVSYPFEPWHWEWVGT